MPEQSQNGQQQTQEQTPTQGVTASQPTAPVSSAQASEGEAWKAQYQQLKDAVTQYFAANPAQTAATAPAKPDVELALSDPEKYQEQLMSAVDSRMAAYAQQLGGALIQPQIETARHLSRQDPSLSVVWQKYGAEVESIMNNPAVPAQMRANKAAWDQAARLVKGNHVDEIAGEMARQLATNISSSAVEGGSPATGAASTDKSSFAALGDSEYGKSVLGSYTKGEIIDMCRARGISVDKFAEECKNTNVVRNPKNAGEWTTDWSKLARAR